MDSAAVTVQQRQQFLEAIERLTKSRVLNGSESLCKLLRYLADHSIQNPGVPVKEYQIATEVLGRSADFDPHSDSAIRVQAGRLRVKLAEYYSTEGEGDPILVELPRGSYTLSFRPRAVKSQGHANAGDLIRAGRNQGSVWTWAGSVLALSVLLAAGVAALVARWGESSRKSTPSLPPTDSPKLRLFWKGFMSSESDPWVVFSNAAFVGRPETGMRYRGASEAPGTFVLDHYTGVGEVLAVHELDRVFHHFNREIRVKRGSLLSLDDAKNNNLIFVGSPAENLSLLEIPGSREFVFQRMTSGPRKGDLGVLNVHPQPGEEKVFLATPGPPLVEDYAVISLVKGLNPGRTLLMLAGTTTIGTEAAVEYVCRQNSLEELLLRLSMSDTGEVKPFEAVLRVKVTRGVPVETQLVALRKTVQ